MKPVVLITRPSPDAEDFAQQVESIGYAPLIDPLLTSSYYSVIMPATLPQALVATSAHAFPTPAPDAWRSLPVFVMGQNSARQARQAGYKNIISANGNFPELIRLLTQTIIPGGSVLYLRGEVVRHDLPQMLPGYNVSEQIVYAMHPATSLAPQTCDAMQDKAVHTATFFSPRSAHTFAQLLEKQGLIGLATHINVLCLSTAVLESVHHIPWRHIETAAQPDRDGMLAVLRTWMDQSHE